MRWAAAGEMEGPGERTIYHALLTPFTGTSLLIDQVAFCAFWQAFFKFIPLLVVWPALFPDRPVLQICGDLVFFIRCGDWMGSVVCQAAACTLGPCQTREFATCQGSARKGCHLRITLEFQTTELDNDSLVCQAAKAMSPLSLLTTKISHRISLRRDRYGN